MIAKVDGILEHVGPDRAMVRLGVGITLEVLLPAYTAARLGGSLDQPVTLHTLAFFEAESQGASMVPRLAGFATDHDRQFYTLFTTCKGIGRRRALRAMTLATNQIAAAIEDRDLPLLQTLPEIGKRTAETVVATLRGKVGHFIDAKPALSESASEGPDHGAGSTSSLSREALNVLVQLGERRQDAAAWIDRAMSQDDPPTDVQSVIAEVYRIKAGG